MIIELVWIVVWTMVLLLASRDYQDARFDLVLARQTNLRDAVLMAERFEDLTLAMVIMALGSALIGVFAIVTPLTSWSGSPAFRLTSSLIFIAMALVVLALKWVALRHRYTALRGNDDRNGMLRWALLASIGARTRAAKSEVASRTKERQK